jgi:hypothetical protein
MNSLKSRAMHCGPLPEMIRGFASGHFSLAPEDHFNIGFLHRLPQIPRGAWSSRVTARISPEPKSLARGPPAVTSRLFFLPS